MKSSKNNLKDRTCSTCGHQVKVYRRNLTPDMIRTLLVLYVETLARKALNKTVQNPHGLTHDWIQMRKVMAVSPYGINVCIEAFRLKHWGFIQAHQKHNGYWKVNLLDTNAFLGIHPVPSYKYITENQVVEEAESFLLITDFVPQEEIDHMMQYLPDTTEPPFGYGVSEDPPEKKSLFKKIFG